MRIVILSMAYFPRMGGLQKVTFELAKQYAIRGIDVHILTAVQNDGSYNDRLENITVHRLQVLGKMFADSSIILKIVNHIIFNTKVFPKLLQLRPDYIHCQTPYSSLGAWVYYKLRQKPYSISFHAEIKTQVGIMLTPRFSKHWKHLPYIRDSHNIFVLTEAMKQDLAMGSVPSIVIPNGVDTEFYSPANLRTSFKEVPTVICVGRLVKSKAIDDAILAIEQVISSHPNVKMVIVGDGPEKENLQNLVRTKGLQDVISFTGRLDAEGVRTFYQSSHIFFQSSLTESFSLVALEAMSCGLPIISTPVGFAPDAIRYVNNGFIVDCHDISSMAKSLSGILDMQNDEYESMCEKSRNYAKRYSWDEIAECYLREYDQNLVPTHKIESGN